MGKGARNRQKRLRTGIATGYNIEYEGKRAPLPEHNNGQHEWTVVAAFRVNPEADKQYQLDMENLMSVEGPGCLHCERGWTPQRAAKPCPGEPQVL